METPLLAAVALFLWATVRYFLGKPLSAGEAVAGAAVVYVLHA